MLSRVEYRELEPPEALRHLVKAGWTLSVPASVEWVSHVATPDGCLELIRRLEGRSQWKGEQPACFVAGLVTRPAELRLSGGSRFVALRIWPWTWRAISGRSPAALTDGWADLNNLAADLMLPSRVEDCFNAVRILLHPADKDVTEAVLHSHSCRELAARTARSPRSLQRWFADHVGCAPRTYFRLLRFGDAFARLPQSAASLAEHALDHGFADQAHMAREFRTLAGARASDARAQGEGPFIAGN